MADNKIVSVIDPDADSTAAVERVLRAMNLESVVYPSGVEFLEKLDLEQPGCVILEVKVSDMNGLQIQEELVARQAPQAVVFLSDHATVSMAVRALRSGAVHFLEKPVRENELWLAVTEALDVDEKRRKVLAKWHEIRERVAMLDEEERQLAGLVIAGKTNRQMANELDVCLRTIELRRSRMMRKLDVKNVGQLVQLYWALENNGHPTKQANGRQRTPPTLRFDQPLVPGN